MVGRRLGILLRGLVPLVATLSVAAAVQAQTVMLTHDIDLVIDPGGAEAPEIRELKCGGALVHYSQTDGRWAYFTARGDLSIPLGRCGCRSNNAAISSSI